ncbi:MAG: AAA family ATPase [archaeon]|nr:AAA family ATPase [archaeon]
MIKGIRLENWKTHYNTELDFSKGTNVIVGKMGSGKSSIMDAISFALYGTFPTLATRKVTLEETIMAKPSKQDTAKITLEFDYNGKEYSVERIVKRKGINEGTLREAGKILAGPKTTETTKKIEEILEVSYELFSRAIYSEQNQIDFFLKLNPSQRKEKFDELLGLDKYEKVRTNSVTLANRLKRTIEDRKKFLQEQKNKSNPKELEEYEKRILEKEKDLIEKEKENSELEKEISEKEKILKQFEEKEKEHKFLKELEIQSRAKTESLTEQLKTSKEKLKGTKAEELAGKIKENKKILEGNEKEIEKIEKEIEKIEKKVSKIKEEIAVQKNRFNSNSKSVSAAQKLESNCPICKRPLSEHDKEKLEKELKEEEEKILKNTKELDSELEKELKELKKIEEELGKISKKNEVIEKEIHELERLKEISEELNEKEKQKNNLEKETEKVREMLKKTGFDEKEHEKHEKEFLGLKEKSAKIRAEISSGKELLKELNESVKRIKETEKQTKELETKIKGNEKATEKLAIFTSALKSTQGELRNMMVETVNQAMEEIWPRIYPYEDFLNAKIIVEEGSYEVMVKQRNEEWARVEGILSGGERSAVAITLRIAISLVLTQNLGWIILDEPTHNLDVNAVKELSETMRNHLPELIEQIFIITHDKEMENAASGKLYTLEREKEKDGPTKILGF